MLRTVRGTSGHSVRDKLPQVIQPTLLICGKQDTVVDSVQAMDAVKGLPNFRILLLDRCGHAPQIELASRLNREVRGFLLEPSPPMKPAATIAMTTDQ
jgi:pimeloyl-ACP methyl ester carboxylesterase